MATNRWISVREKTSDALLAVPVRIKIVGIMLLPVLILGFALNYWIRTGLSDWLSYLLSDERVEIAMQAGSRSVILVTTLATVVSILLTFLLMLVLTRPLLELRQVAERVAKGERASRARVWARDEIGEVAQSVNLMLDQLVTGQQELERTNRRLEALNRVATAVGRGLELHEVLDASLKTTLDVMGLQSGWIVLRDPDNNQFRLANTFALPVEIETALFQSPGKTLCACQRDLLSGELGRAAFVRDCQRLNGLQAAGSLRFGRHVTIPLETGGQQFGIVNLLCTDAPEPSAEDVDLLASIGAQVSEAVANAWLHANLVEKESARQALLNALVRAQEDERARLARELHDGTGQRLTSLLVRLKTLEKRAAAEELRASVADLCQAASETIEHVRGISHRLRPAALEEFGLEVALRTLAQEMADEAGLSVECQLKLEGRRLPFEVETSLYRIAQECLTNVVRHAEASRVLIELTVLPYAICLRVEDDGQGFDPGDITGRDKQRRLGLVSIQERAEMLGGSLVVHSAPGEGTSVQVRLPLQMETPK